jgi:hypothetical protein
MVSSGSTRIESASKGIARFSLAFFCMLVHDHSLYEAAACTAREKSVVIPQIRNFLGTDDAKMERLQS